MGAEQSSLDTYTPSVPPERRRGQPEEGEPGSSAAGPQEPLPPTSALDDVDNNGWTMCMHAAESNNADLLRRLLKAGCDTGAASTRTWGMFDAGSTALDIAELLQSRLGIDRSEVIDLLQVDADTADAQAQRRAQLEAEAREQEDAEARRLAAEEAQRKIAAAREKQGAAERRLREAEERAAAERSRLSELGQSPAELERERLLAATAAAQSRAADEERRVAKAQQRAEGARQSGEAIDIAEMISNQMVAALDQAAVGLLGGTPQAVRTVSAAREEAETDAGKHLSERITSVLRAKHGDLRSFFDVADKNGDGVLSAEEVKAALQQHVGISLNGTELSQIILWADKDRSGAIDVNEFLRSFQ